MTAASIVAASASSGDPARLICPDWAQQARARLLEQMGSHGHWRGHLASSALSTATAVIALTQVNAPQHSPEVGRGLDWLRQQQNADGGWGDTDLSFSNLSTTLLVWSAFGAAGHADDPVVARAREWVERQVGTLDPMPLSVAVAERYGKDRTFSVPILMACAIGGVLGRSGNEWRRVWPLPFELAALPRSWFAAVRLPVVSYALPALIAIGQARFQQAPPSRLTPWYWWRRLVRGRTSRLLAGLQPSSGGFLEATPLTSFVTMALVQGGDRNHPVVAPAVVFLRRSQREDGSWPIDTDLATWTSTLAVKALHPAPAPAPVTLTDPQQAALRTWLLDQQYQTVHPFTDAAPGGWAWTDLPGGVPDADDTPGALLALHALDDGSELVLTAAAAGCQWLIDLQNRDGGVPTFCRGWGTLPFDRSSADLTAHCLRAWAVWRGRLDARLVRRIDRARTLALGFLARQQHDDGSWLPLWFGNQHVKDEVNPLYGTAMVVASLVSPDVLPGDAVQRRDWLMRLDRAVDWLLRSQGSDGGWGGAVGAPASVEETALAVSALARVLGNGLGSADPAALALALGRGIDWLGQATDQGRRFPVAPIGFYFARLWYHERLYPLVWTVDALASVQRAALASRDR